ncbi:MAG: hypothetical protein KFB94_08360 [Methylophilaceae bacterium]|nr:MAG: hypothetical protein KFB94_08360 [Methylophilaceae bacterium]
MSLRIEIDFVKPAWYSIKRVTPLGASLMCLSIILFIGTFSSVLEQREQSNMRKLAASLQPPAPVALEAKAKEPALNHTQTQILNAMIKELNAPWDVLLTALETMQNPDIALINILPNHQKQQLDLIGEARNIPAMLRYIESLEALEMLDHVTLQKHQVNETHPYQPVEFAIVARWR